MTYHIRNAASILTKVPYITLATSSQDSLPWNTPLGFKIDKDLNFYWVSEHSKQHSKNIKENKNVFIVIYDSTLPEEEGEAIYINARAQELDEPQDIKYARRLLKGTDEDALAKLSGESLHRAYRAIPQKIWVNGPKDAHPDTWRDTRFEVNITDLKNFMLSPHIGL